MRYVLFFAIYFFSLGLLGQEKHRCGTDEYMAAYYQQFPNELKAKELSFQDFYKNKKAIAMANRMNITIPVHVIIVHAPGEAIGSGSNFSLAHIESQIQVLNEDFGRTNSNAVDTPPEFLVGDTGIRFQLASQNPNGAPTDGVTRYSTDLNFGSNAYGIREETAWPREDYMNIWVAPDLSYLGLATVASINNIPSDPINDFIHVEATTFGGPGFGTLAPYDLGRTTTHEVGHWLGCYHVWRNSGCGNDDGFEDTPLQDDENYDCPTHPSPSCSNSGDMFMNYMDYSDDACMNAFTVDQGEYMVAVLNGSRSSLLVSEGLNTPIALELNIIQSLNPLCENSADGIIEVAAFGGSGIGYTYQINGFGTNTNGFFVGLPAGNYIIKTTDSNGQVLFTEVILSAPPALNLAINNDDNKCFGDSTGVVIAQGNGGTGTLSYTINGSTPQTMGIFSGLPNGEYEIAVYDEGGCVNISLTNISSPSQIGIDSLLIINSGCYGDSLASVEVDATGGLGDYLYAVNDTFFQNVNEFDSLAAGEIIISIQDMNGCIYSFDTLITQPDSLELIVLDKQNTSCNAGDDGSITLKALGGVGGYIYSIDSISFVEDTTLTMLGGGVYTFYAKDTIGCVAMVSDTIYEAPAIQVFDIEVEKSACADSTGHIEIQAIGGTGSLTYSLDGIINEDGNFNNLSKGEYTILITDENQCVEEILVGIDEINDIDISSIVVNDIACEMDTTGGIIIETGNSELVFSLNGISNNTGSFIGLPIGNYQVEIKDTSNCTETIDFSIFDTFDLEGLGVSNLNCFESNNGSVTSSIYGGSGDFTYLIYNNDNDIVENGELIAGLYNYVVIDNPSGCEVSSVFEVTQPTELLLDANITTSQETNILLIPSGGTAPYLFSYDGGVTLQNSAEYNNLPAGEYVFTVYDANGCTASYSYEVVATINIGNITDVRLVPNPFKDYISIAYHVESNKNVTISLIDFNGRLINNYYVTFTKDEHQYLISSEDLLSGFYILRLKLSNEEVYLKAIKY